jgi:hypothetical protein
MRYITSKIQNTNKITPSNGNFSRERQYQEVVSSYEDGIQYDPLGIFYVPEVWQTGISQSDFEEIQQREPTQNIQETLTRQKPHLHHMSSYMTQILHRKMES